MTKRSLPHEFHDGVSETASGAQVTENDAALKGWIERLEEIVEKFFNKELASITGVEQFAAAWGALTTRELAKAIEPSSSRPSEIFGVIVYSTTGQTCQLKIGGVTVVESEGGAGANVSMPIGPFPVKPGEKYEFTGNPFQVKTSHKLL